MSNFPQNTTTTTTNYPVYVRKEPRMIEVPAYLHVDLHGGARMSGRVVKYSDPRDATPYGAFLMEDDAGVVNYVPWPNVLRLTVFPLTVTPPAEAPHA